MSKAIRIKLVRSACGRIPAHRATVRGLGLRRTYQERVVIDSPEVRGMIKQVPHLVHIVEEGLSLGQARG